MMGRWQKISGVKSAIFLNRAASSLLLIISFFLCLSSSVMASPNPDEPDRRPSIVVLLPLSGELEPVGRQLLEAATLGGDEVGVGVEAIDSAQSSQKVLAELGELKARSDVAAVIGPPERRLARAAAQKAQEVGLPLVVFSPLEGVESIGGWIFRALPSLGEQSARIASYLVEERGLKRAAVLAPRSPFGEEALSALVREFNSYGGTVAGFATYQEGTTNFRPALETLVGRRLFLGRGRSFGRRKADRFGTVELRAEGNVDFDALIIADSHEVVARILPFLPRVGIQSGAGGSGQAVQLVGLSSWRGEGLAKAGEYGVGAVFFDTYGGVPMGGMAEEFEERFRARLGRRPTTAEAEIYDLVGMIGSGIQAKQEGETWPQAALSRLREPTSYPGVAGSWSFDEEGAPVRYLRPFRVVEEGRWVPADGASP